jgi:hypothetical protein
VSEAPKPFDQPFPAGTVFHITGGGFRTLFPPKVYATDAEIESNSVTILYEVERITGES